MGIPGRVRNGVVVPAGHAVLPEGARVTVLCDKVLIRRKPGKKKRVRLPLVDSKNPGSVRLTNERVAEILDQEDVAPRH
jgi:hypothetical protein